MPFLTFAALRTRPRPRPTAPLVALALLALAGCGAPANPHPTKLDSYVAMGDSYTAVAGAGPYTDLGCRRSEGDYPQLVAHELGITNFTDASCGGATSESLTQDQVLPNPRGSRPPQLKGLSARTRLVTLGIGLNNYQLAYYLLYVCVPVNGITLPACSQYLGQSDKAVDRIVRNVSRLVRANLRQIRRAAPNARVVLVGYPKPLADRSTCPAQLPIPDAAADRLRSTMADVNRRYRQVAKAARVDYIDMWSASEGHDVCSSEPWVNGFRNVPGKALQFHPYEAYHRAVADKIVALLKK